MVDCCLRQAPTRRTSIAVPTADTRKPASSTLLFGWSRRSSKSVLRQVLTQNQKPSAENQIAAKPKPKPKPKTKNQKKTKVYLLSLSCVLLSLRVVLTLCNVSLYDFGERVVLLVERCRSNHGTHSVPLPYQLLGVMHSVLVWFLPQTLGSKKSSISS